MPGRRVQFRDLFFNENPNKGDKEEENGDDEKNETDTEIKINRKDSVNDDNFFETMTSFQNLTLGSIDTDHLVFKFLMKIAHRYSKKS